MAKAPIYAAMEGVIAGCLEKEPAKRRQRVQNAVIELKLAGRSIVRSPEIASHKPVRQRAVPAPAAAPGHRAPAPRANTITAPRPHVMPYDSPGTKVYASSIQKRILLIAGAVLALTASSVAAVVFLHTAAGRAAPAIRRSAT